MSDIRTVAPDELNYIMGFDHVIRVLPTGQVDTRPVGAPREPSLEDDVLSSRFSGWEFFTHGYSGQYGYTGPIMHNSEFIGGQLAADILATPGWYVALVSNYYCGPDCKEECDGDHAEGWAIAHIPA